MAGHQSGNISRLMNMLCAHSHPQTVRQQFLLLWACNLITTYRDAEAIIRPCLQGARLATAEHAIDALRACILIVLGKIARDTFIRVTLKCAILICTERWNNRV